MDLKALVNPQSPEFVESSRKMERPEVTGITQRLEGKELVKLLARHDRDILRYIQVFLPDRTDAEEVLQRTAVALWEKLDLFDVSREFLPWALHQAYYQVLNFRKEYARSKLVFSEDLVELLDSERENQENYLLEMKDALKVCIEKVSSTDQHLLQCRYSDAKPISQMAAELGKTAKSLYRRLDRVREMLEKCVENRLNSMDPNC